MSNESTGKRRRRIVLWISGLLALYVLSVGPMAKILTRDAASLGQLACIIVYYPLIMLGTAFRPFRELLDWYCHLFG